jgi:tetratricopeptide (TPR) repeat protein
MLDRGQDSALLRYSIGTELVRIGNADQAAPHFQAAVELDPGYSAAWKELGRTLAQLGREGEAIAAYQAGVAVAEKKGDRQAAREMTVFLRRLLKKRDG